jgi:hypothetical protein
LMRRFLTEAKSGDVADRSRTHVVGAVYYHRAQENEYEIHNRHAFAHDICHNRCGCAGWKRAWPPQVAGHRHATAGTCADDCFVDKAAVEAFPAQVGISFNDEIAANRSRQRLRGFSERVKRTFRKAATKYLEENQHKRGLDGMRARRVHHGTLQPLVRSRLALASVQVRSIAVVRRILNLSARLWRDESDRSWLETRPLIQMQRHPHGGRRSGSYTRACKR